MKTLKQFLTEARELDSDCADKLEDIVNRLLKLKPNNINADRIDFHTNRLDDLDIKYNLRRKYPGVFRLQNNFDSAVEESKRDYDIFVNELEKMSNQITVYVDENE